MVTTEHLTFERDGATAIVTMNRPEAKNALSLPMLVGMKDAWEEIDGNDDIRCAILTGAGGTFCAGMDLKAMGGSDAEKYQSRMAEDPDLHWKALLRHYDLRKPLIAAVEGWAVAGGTEILQATDIRVAGESAVFGVFEAKRGLFPLGGSTVRLRRQIPYTLAMELLLTAREVPAEEALRIGLIGHVVPDGTALDKALEIAAVIGRTGRWRSRPSRACARPRGCPRWTAWPASSRSAGPSSPATTPPRDRRPSPRSARPSTPARERGSRRSTPRPAGGSRASTARRPPQGRAHERPGRRGASHHRGDGRPAGGRGARHGGGDPVGCCGGRLEAAAPDEKRTRNQPFAEGHPQDIFPTSPVIGFANPVAPPVEVWAVEGENGAREVRGRVTFGYAYEGPPTCVHGGVIAELFDELLGMSNILAGQGA